MITTDLKLLVDVAWINRHAQTPYRPGRGEYAAVERLVKRGLIMNAGGGEIGITEEGDQLVKQLSERIRRFSSEKQP